MKRPDPLLLVLGGLCGAGLLTLLFLAGGRSGSVGTDDAAARPVVGSRPARPASSILPPARNTERRETVFARLAQEEDPTEAATELRTHAMASKDTLRALIAKLGDPGLDGRVRDRIAFVLGSIADLEAEQALRAALRKGGDPDRVAALLLALGSTKSLENPFELAAFDPYVESHGSGLNVYVHTVFADEGLVAEIAEKLTDESDAVRRAAHRALQVTLLYDADRRKSDGEPAMDRVRREFLARVRDEPVEGLRAAFAGTLADWAARAPGDSEAKRETLEGLVDASLREEASTVRLRTAAGLAQSKLPAGAMERLREAAAAGDPDVRSWAIPVLAAQARRMQGADREAAWKVLERSLADPDSKIREHAAGALGGLEEGLSSLIAAAEDADWNVRAAVARSLGAFPSFHIAREALRRIEAQDENEHVRRAAADSLRRFPR